MPLALITGITGQDGSFLADFLLDKGYEVHGMVRRTSSLERSRLQHLYADPAIYGKRLFLHYADLEDITVLRRILTSVKPTELYHLAGQSHVGLSFEIPETTCNLTAMGTLRLLEVIRDLPSPPRLFHPSSSEIFGEPAEYPQTEETPFNPLTPYGCAKAFATQMTRIYRASFALFACNGIMYNHESTRRGENFVSKKICSGVAAIKLGHQKKLRLGSLQGERDWGFAGDYVRGMWLALQQEVPDDYVFATGRLHTVKQLVQIAFDVAGLPWEDFIEIDPHLLRKSDPVRLVGDAKRAEKILGWEHSVTFEEMIRAMTQFEIEKLRATGDNSRVPR